MKGNKQKAIQNGVIEPLSITKNILQPSAVSHTTIPVITFFLKSLKSIYLTLPDSEGLQISHKLVECQHGIDRTKFVYSL